MAAPQEPGLEKPVLSAEASVLAPAVKVPEHANGYLLTLRETNAWWKVNTTLEALELVKNAWRELNGGDIAPPALEPHAVAGAPGALFIQQGAPPAGAKEVSTVVIAHRVLEDIQNVKEAAALGEHLVRVLPVEDTCALEVGAIENMAKALVAKHLSEEVKPTEFAVRPETHSPHLKEGVVVGDLVRRVADMVPAKHTVRLVDPQKTILLMVVGDGAMLSVVEDWHALHKFNVHEIRKGAAA